jgi:predicted PhzF superfamily epimerase YddE/YHI9
MSEYQTIYYVNRVAPDARTDEDAAMAFVSKGPVDSLSKAQTLLADCLEAEAEELRPHLESAWPAGDDWFVVRIAQLKQAARMVRENAGIETANVGNIRFTVRRARLALA